MCMFAFLSPVVGNDCINLKVFSLLSFALKEGRAGFYFSLKNKNLHFLSLRLIGLISRNNI